MVGSMARLCIATLCSIHDLLNSHLDKILLLSSHLLKDTLIDTLHKIICPHQVIKEHAASFFALLILNFSTMFAPDDAHLHGSGLRKRKQMHY